MKRFPELKPNFWDVIVVLAVIALAALSAMTVWRGGTETGALTAVVTADGQEIDRFAPADLLDAPRTYSYNGVTLTVAAEDGNGLRVSSSDCPTQDCVHTGTISRSGQSIVCLPARIVIQLTGGAAEVTLDNGGKLLLLQRVLVSLAPSLRVYRRPSQRVAFLESLLALIEELQAYAVAPEVLEQLRQETPIERLGRPEDVAKAIADLADSGFITGQVLGVSGGFVIT